MFTFNPKDRVYHNFIVSRKPAIIEVSVKYFVMLAMVECVLGPFVYMINYSIFLAKMTNKLYHAKKAELITEKKKRQKKQKGEKDPIAEVRGKMDERESLKISWLDVFLYKFVKCNCYRNCHKDKTLKFYKGKIIYEAEQKFINDGDIGSMVSWVRKSRIMVTSMLDRDSYTFLKYQ
jgi:hypothetical protein